MSARASDDKLLSVFSFIRGFLSYDKIAIKDLAKIAGKIASLKPALGFFVLLTSRSAYATIARHVDQFGWSGYTTLSSETKRELELFLDHATSLNGCPLNQEYRQQSIQSLLSSSEIFAGDASAIGACAYSVQSPSKHFFQTQFSTEEMALFSGHRELLTLKKAILSGVIPSSTSVAWFTDSTNLVAFWEKGSPNIDIQFDVIETLLSCKDQNIELRVLHLSREDPRIEAADAGSRYFDKDDWGIDEASFSVLQFRFLPLGFTLDLFASPSNARVSRFYSQYAYPGSDATDAFSVSWENECVFVCPPIGKLISSWKKITLTKNVKGVIVFPAWKPALYWTFLFHDGRHTSWPANSVEKFNPFIILGQFYSGVMNGRNNYKFCAIFFDTSVIVPAPKTDLLYIE